MTVLLLVGAVLWVNVDASRELGGARHEIPERVEPSLSRV